MRITNLILVQIVTLLCSVILSVYIIDQIHVESTIKFVVVDQHKLVGHFLDTLDDELSVSEKNKKIDDFSKELLITITNYQSRTGVIVLNKEAVAIPTKNDITDALESFLFQSDK